ncbi:MAG TPA: hypothetical protein VHE81_01125 [Lacipirellulaceae bacterium]|nr:hypothetical protein [Lacipirellulaceae bacterium]
MQELQKAVINAAGRHDLAKEITRFEISSVAHHIRCPTLLTKAEGDPIAAGSHTLYEGIKLSKDIRGFSLAEGSGGHCEALARALYHQRVFDWLDGTLLFNC